MAAYTSLLLVIACAATGYSLQCYTCESQATNANCLTATQCPSNASYCLTTVAVATYVGNSAASIIKRCEQYCTPTSTSISGATATVTCCNTDLCNTSGGANIKSSCAAILLALGSILTILRSSAL